MAMAKTLLAAVCICLLLLSGCEFDHTATGPLRDEPVSVERGQVERANIEFDMGAGEMTLRSGADKLLEGHFEYNVPSWKPQVRTSINGSHATITIKQPAHGHTGGNRRYLWDLTLNN